MGGKTTSRSKNAYTKKNYDQVRVVVPKGKKDFYMKVAQEAGFESLNSYINHCVMKDIAERKGPQRPEEVKKAEFIKLLLPDIRIENAICICEQELLKAEIVKSFPEAEVECCCQEDLDQYQAGAFDLVILTKPVRYLKKAEQALTHIKDITRAGGMFLWLFDEGDDAEFTFSVTKGGAGKPTREFSTDPLVVTERLLEEVDTFGEYSFLEIDRHGYEPWVYVCAWKAADEEIVEAAIQQRNEQLTHYSATQLAISSGR